MPQLSLYITEENLEMLRARSEETGLSMSKYANRLIEHDAEERGWKPGFWDLYGALGDDDFPVPDDAPPDDDAEFERLFS